MDLGGTLLWQVLLSAKLFTHCHSGWGKQPSLEEPESGVREALHLGGGGAGTGHRSNQVNTIKETEGCGMGRGDVPEVTRPCDRAGIRISC